MSTEAKSFKQMIQGGEVRRADAMKIPLDDIHEEPGFNARLNTDSEEFTAGIRQFAEYIAAGGTYPALEVRPRPAGGVWVVEGHRRRLALRMARDELGAPIEFVPIVAFVGNDADRFARISTSASQVLLTPLEHALNYKRMAGLGLSADEIAAKVGKTRQHVDQLLILANGNTDVQKLVAAGGVSAAVAVKVVRKHGENAGKVLNEELGRAKAAGKGKVTDGTMKPKALPPKVVAGVVDELDAFFGTLTTAERTILAEIESGAREGATVMVDGRALLALLDEHEKIVGARNKLADRQRMKAEKAAQGELA
jgi:ParB-like chromosome segregation protein Spo0J